MSPWGLVCTQLLLNLRLSSPSKCAASPQLPCTRATSHPWSLREWKTHGADNGNKGDMPPLQPPHPFPLPLPVMKDTRLQACTLIPLDSYTQSKAEVGYRALGLAPFPGPGAVSSGRAAVSECPLLVPFLDSLDCPSLPHPQHTYVLAASEGFPQCWSKASRPFTCCDVHAFILHPEFSSRAPLEISPCFDDPNVPHETGRGGWAHPTGWPHADLPVGSQVVLKNLLGLRRQSRGLKCLWVCADLHQQKTWHAPSLVSRATEVTFYCYQHRGEGGRDYNPRSSGPSVELVTLCLGI